MLLEKDKVKHGNFSAESIFQAGSKYKTYHPEVLKPISGDNLNKFLGKKKHYSSPEQVSSFKKQIGKPPLNTINSTISDIYALGLVLLELCTLQQERDYYNSDLTVNKGLIQQKLTDMSNPYSNEFMEMIIRMLTIDPANRITVEELIQLTSLQPGERDVLNSEPNLVSGDDAIRPHPMHAMPSRIVADKEIPGQAVNRSDSREIPQFAGYQGAPQAINQGTYVAPLEQNRNAFFQPSAPSQIFNAISTNQIQFKPSGVDNGDHGLNSRHQQSQNEQKGDERAIQRSVSRGNFFDPSILNRVNIARDQSRQPLTGRDVSPIPTAHGASSQRVHNLEGSAISSSRVKRKDLSKSPLKKVYGSRLAEDDRSNSRTPHTQSMQNISLNDNTSMNPVKHSILQSGLNNGVYHNQSERIVGFKPNSKVETPGLQGFNSSSQTNLHQSSQITNPLQMRYPLSSNQAYNSKFYNQSQPGLIVSQQPVISNQRVAQPAQKRDLTPVRIDSQDRPMTSYSQKGVVTVRENKIPPIPTQTGRVTRYSVDKNGQRHLISDSQPQIPRSQVIQGSMPNIVTNGLGWNSKNGNQTYENTSHLGGVYNRPTPGYASQHYQNSTGVIRSALGHQIQSYGGEIQTNSQGTGIQTANEVALPRK